MGQVSLRQDRAGAFPMASTYPQPSGNSRGGERETQLCVLLGFFFFFHFLATPHGMWDLGFPTRNRTQATSIGEQSLNHWMAGEVPQHMLLAMNRVTSHSASQTWQTHHLSNRPLLLLRQIVCVCVCVCVCIYIYIYI